MNEAQAASRLRGRRLTREGNWKVWDCFRDGVLGFLFVLMMVSAIAFSFGQSKSVELNLFADGSGKTSFPFEFSGGMVIVPVTLKGSMPLRFVLDSGSTRMLIDRAVAVSLGYKESDASSLQGAGKGRIPVHAVHDVELKIPGLETKGYECFTADLKPLEQSTGTRVDGILGYEFLKRFVVTIDFDAKQLTVEVPASFRPSNSFEELPLEIRDKWAFVKGELLFPGQVTVQDSFFIDSGSSDAVDHPIVKTLQNATASTSGVGLGTPVEGAVAVATSFQIGSFTMTGPPVACCGATEATSRSMGTEILRRFTVIFDYPSSRLFLKPNRLLHAPFGPAQ
jgi:hypothetical protein